jgi:putative membrane protein
MILASLVFAFLAAALHVFIFTLESVNWTKPATWKRFNIASQQDAETTKSLAYTQGFYNLFLAIGAFIGLALVAVGGDGSAQDVAGWTLVFACCGSMLLAALVLALSGKKNLRPAVTQGITPLIAVVLGLIAVTS